MEDDGEEKEKRSRISHDFSITFSLPSVLTL